MITVESEVKKINAQLEKQQGRLNDFKPLPMLSDLTGEEEAESYLGTCDDVVDLLEKRSIFIENRRSVIDDVLFMTHQIIKKVVELPLEEAERVTLVRQLEINKIRLQKRSRVLHDLDVLYKSIVIEPAIEQLPDGERPDSTRFRVLISPIPSVSANESVILRDHWHRLLHKLERQITTPIKLKMLIQSTD